MAEDAARFSAYRAHNWATRGDPRAARNHFVIVSNREKIASYRVAVMFVETRHDVYCRNTDHAASRPEMLTFHAPCAILFVTKICQGREDVVPARKLLSLKESLRARGKSCSPFRNAECRPLPSKLNKLIALEDIIS